MIGQLWSTTRAHVLNARACIHAPHMFKACYFAAFFTLLPFRASAGRGGRQQSDMSAGFLVPRPPCMALIHIPTLSYPQGHLSTGFQGPRRFNAPTFSRPETALTRCAQLRHLISVRLRTPGTVVGDTLEMLAVSDRRLCPGPRHLLRVRTSNEPAAPETRVITARASTTSRYGAESCRNLSLHL